MYRNKSRTSIKPRINSRMSSAVKDRQTMFDIRKYHTEIKKGDELNNTKVWLDKSNWSKGSLFMDKNEETSGGGGWRSKSKKKVSVDGVNKEVIHVHVPPSNAKEFVFYFYLQLINFPLRVKEQIFKFVVNIPLKELEEDSSLYNNNNNNNNNNNQIIKIEVKCELREYHDKTWEWALDFNCINKRELLNNNNNNNNNNKISWFIDISRFSFLKKYYLTQIKLQHVINILSKTKDENSLKFDALSLKAWDPSNISADNPWVLRMKFWLKKKDNIQKPTVNHQKKGIRNEGFTCYMNSIIQTMFNLPFFRNQLIEIDVVNSKNNENDTIITTLQKIFIVLFGMNTTRSIRWLSLFDAWNWNKSFWNRPQDAHEIYSLLFDIIMDYSSNWKANCIGELNTNVFCEEVNFTNNRSEPFLFLNLSINAGSSLEDCLDNFFSPEDLTGDNKYQYEKAKGEYVYWDAIKRSSISKLPNILFIQLKRFKYNFKQNTFNKIYKEIQYSLKLDWKPYWREGYSEKNSEYLLYSVIVHSGTINMGHYYTYINDYNNNNWIRCNDDNIEIANITEVWNENFGGVYSNVIMDYDTNQLMTIETENEKTAYIWIYVKNDGIDDIMGSNSDMNLEILREREERLQKEWALTFDKEQNIITESLKKFSINNTNTDYMNLHANSKDKFPQHNETNSHSQPLSSDIVNNIEDVFNKKISKEKPKFVKDDISPKLNNNINSDDTTSIANEKQYKSSVGFNKPSYQPSNNTQNSFLHKQSISKIFIQPKRINLGVAPLVNQEYKIISPSIKSGLKFKFVNNATNAIVAEVSSNCYTHTKKLPVVEWIDSLYSKIEMKTFDWANTKLIKWNRIGYYLATVNDSENAIEYLKEYAEKKIILMIYIFDFDENYNSSTAYISTLNYYNPNKKTEDSLVPIIWINHSMFLYSKNWTKELIGKVKSVFTEAKDIQWKIIDSREESWKTITNYNSLKTNIFDEFEEKKVMMYYQSIQGKGIAKVYRFYAEEIQHD